MAAGEQFVHKNPPRADFQPFCDPCWKSGNRRSGSKVPENAISGVVVQDVVRVEIPMHQALPMQLLKKHR